MSFRLPHQCLAVFLSGLLITAGPVTAFAQEDDDEAMTFGVDEVVPEEEEPAEVEDQTGDGFTFTPEEAQASSEKEQEKPKTVALVTVPSKVLTSAQRATLASEVKQSLQQVPKLDLQGSDRALQALQERDPDLEYCVQEQLCLANVGRDAGVESLLLARVTPGEAGLRFDLEYFDVEDKLFIKADKRESVANFEQVLEAVDPMVKEVFEIRERRIEDPGYVEDSSAVTSILAYTTAGLAVACLGGGIVFGLQVNSDQDALQNDLDAGTLTQVEADERKSDAEGKALAANVLFGLAGGLAVVSAILFITDSDEPSDAAATADSMWERIDIEPSLSPRAVGIGASVQF